MYILKNVRHKLKDGKKHPKYIETVWGVGYKFIGLPGK
ncbi:helix-turn-helix domain-containing protein [Bacillus sp. JCM 19041]